jgi:divalent metal cation (Fe/Co/Zn/Cd) transporter
MSIDRRAVAREPDPSSVGSSDRDMSRLPAAGRAHSVRRGRLLQYLTILWNCAECVVALGAGIASGSISLVGFGFDSGIEVASSLAALWRLRADHDEEGRELAERRAMRIIGVSFLLLAVYVLVDALKMLIDRQPPAQSPMGMVIAALSLTVMPVLVRYKRRVAVRLQSGTLAAEARQTKVCAYLSGILLTGLLLNSWLGWWWADPVAAIVMVPLIAWEGRQALTGRTCCAD